MMSKVSVIITSYNYGAYIGQAIESVLNQTYRNFEVVVVDDGSDDDSIVVINGYVEKYPDVVYLYRHFGNANRGIGASLCLGIEKARGEYIAFCESDDFFEKDNLYCKVKALKDNIDVSLVYSGINVVGGGYSKQFYYYLKAVDFFGRVYFKKKRFFNYGAFKFNPIATFTNFACRKEDLKNLVLVEKFEVWSDLQVIIHLSKLGKFLYLKNRLVSWRFHEKSYNYRHKRDVYWKQMVKEFNDFFYYYNGFSLGMLVMCWFLKGVFGLLYPLAILNKLGRKISRG